MFLFIGWMVSNIYSTIVANEMLIPVNNSSECINVRERV